MHIDDDNTLEDIEGHILCLQCDVKEKAPEFPVAPRFTELLARIEDKIKRNTNKIRRNWFETAREYALVAQTAFAEGKSEDSYRALRKCWEYLEQGNKAHRRKATFVATADGTVAPVANPPKQVQSPDTDD